MYNFSATISTMFRLLVIVLIFLTSCRQSNSKDFRETIAQFDSISGSEIDMICKSLLKTVNSKTTYVMMISSTYNEIRFKRFDSLGKINSYFTADFVPSKSQFQFFAEAGIRSLFYDKNRNVFFAKMNAYKLGDEILWMYVFVNPSPAARKPIFFENGNRKYLLIKNE